MSRDPRYQRLLNSKRWAEVKRQVWQRAEGLCERCKRDGIAERGVPYITPGVDCHHKTPVESAKTEQEMERLAYDVNNIELLCIPCHIKTHQEMHSHRKEKVKENKARARRRFMEANDPNFASEREQDDAYISHAEREQSRTKCNYKEEDNGTGTMEADTDDGRQVRGEQPRTGEDKQSTPRVADADQTEERLPIRDGDANQRKAEELEGASAGGNAVHPEPIRIDRG